MIQLRETLVALARNKVDFVIVGGIAASLHGSAYATYDLDLCYSRSKKNLARLTDALAPLHPKLRDAQPGTPFIRDIGTVRQGFNFPLTTDLGAVDLFAEIPGIGGFKEVKKVSGEVKVARRRAPEGSRHAAGTRSVKRSRRNVIYASTSILASAAFPLCHFTSATPAKITSMANASRRPNGSR